MSYSVKMLTAPLVTLILLSVSNAMAMREESLEWYKSHYEGRKKRYKEVKEVGEKFVSFLQKVGQSDNPVTADGIDELFDPLCTKIVNCKPLFTPSLENHAAQLNNARHAAGKWTLMVDGEAIISADDSAYATQIVWKAEKLAEHSTMFKLRINESNKIFTINEVFSPCNQDHLLFQKLQENQ